ncbi:MAG TPA: nitrate- and nitrite sensing domain-containing protein [Actinomycetes bacterium]|jgi:signal transduction histidine kinase|nr:nitrate- and nitrite sensing domain-containing protein [Actinomycetes bacterium]
MLQNLQIRSKLAAILLVPLAAVIVLSSIGIGSRVNQAVKASRAQNVSQFAVTLTALVHELQKERSLAAGYVGGGKSTGYSDLAAQWENVDRQVVVFAREARKLHLSGYGPQLRQQLRDVVSELAKLDAQRQEINQNPDITVADTLTLYDKIIQDILGVNGEIAVGSGNERLLRTVSAFVALSRMKDAVDLQRAYMNAVFSAGHFNAGQLQYRQFTRYVEAEDLWAAQFAGFATPSQRNLLSSTVVGPSVERAKAIRDIAIKGETSPDLKVDPSEWYSVMGDKLNLVRRVEVRLSSDVVATARAVKQSAQRDALIVGFALLAVLVVTIGLSLVIARSMVGPLRRLRQAANDVAEERLPRVVERLQETQDLDRVTLEHASPVPVSSRDEIGQVAAAFNSVHQVAVRVATEQAALRKSIGDMFLNLARRSQNLIDRQLELIDQLERNEADPEALENLFKLDHLATRMRRNAEDLIVLSGAEPPRRWSQPVPLVDVVRASLAEVEDYQRVELLPIDEIGIAGHAVSDVVHMLAEVIENAISFSPPGTKVQVAGQPVSNGYVLEIEDRGLGMSDEELVEANERLANPPLIDFALSRMLGLFVVGRLAQRYGIRVQLRHSWYGGVTALVLLPPSITIRSQVSDTPPSESRLPELAPPPSSAPVPSLDHLPIFEQARSDWFESPPGGPGPSLRRQAQPAGTQASSGNGTAHGPEDETAAAEAVQALSAETSAAEPLTVDPLAAEAEATAEPPGGEEEAEAGPSFAAPTWSAAPPEGTRPEGPDRLDRPEGLEEPPRLPRREPIERADLEPERPSSDSRPAERPVAERTVGRSRPLGEPLAAQQYPFGSVQPPFPRLPEQRPRFGPVQPQGAGSSPLPQRHRPVQPPPPQPAAEPSMPAEHGSRHAMPADIATPLPPTLQAASVQTTKAGLPRRVPRANLAPGMMAQAQRAADERSEPPQPSGFSRSPEEVRSMLSSYRTGLERGRRMAAGDDLNDRGEGTRSGIGGTAPMAPRSDDDATQ